MRQIDNELYDRLAHTWWSESGFLNLLQTTLNPWRVPYFKRTLTQLQIDPHSARALDVGCGGGLLTEELAEMGFAVTGIDPSARSLEFARAHAAEKGLTIGYTDQGKQQALVFRVDKSAIRATLATLEARTGLKVTFQDQEARKASGR